jgi:hypothetical protein
MANIKLKFISEIDCDDDITIVKCDYNILFNINYSGRESQIMLDIPTAIKFAKTLRTEINKAKEVYNG